MENFSSMAPCKKQKLPAKKLHENPLSSQDTVTTKRLKSKLYFSVYLGDVLWTNQNNQLFANKNGGRFCPSDVQYAREVFDCLPLDSCRLEGNLTWL